MLAFIVFYGLDWVATIPPTMALCREVFGAAAPVVFGWVVRLAPGGRGGDGPGAPASCATSWAPTTWPGSSAAALCLLAGGLSLLVKRAPVVARAIP